MNLERHIEKVRSSKPPKTTSPQDRKTTDTTRWECQYCGYSHEPSRLRCPARGKTRSYCHGANHFKAKCQKRDTEDGDDWLQAHELIFGVNGHKVQQRITAMMQVNNCDVRYQLDTRANINTINQRFVCKEQARKTNEKLPIALPVKAKVDILVKRDVLVPVEEPTQWVSQMAVVCKQNSKFRLQCQDVQQGGCAGSILACGI